MALANNNYSRPPRRGASELEEGPQIRSPAAAEPRTPTSGQAGSAPHLSEASGVLLYLQAVEPRRSSQLTFGLARRGDEVLQLRGGRPGKAGLTALPWLRSSRHLPSPTTCNNVVGTMKKKVAGIPEPDVRLVLEMPRFTPPASRSGSTSDCRQAGLMACRSKRLRTRAGSAALRGSTFRSAALQPWRSSASCGKASGGAPTLLNPVTVAVESVYDSKARMIRQP